MRKHIAALLVPAALAASGYAFAQTADETDAAPAAAEAAPEAESAEGEAADAAEAQPVKKPARPQVVNSQAVAGKWTPETVNGRPGVTYLSDDGQSLVSFACLPGEEGMGRTLYTRAQAPSGAAIEEIAIFGGGGSGTVAVSGGSSDGGAISGEFDPASPLAQSLATGQGDLRVQTGTTEIVIPNSEEVETVVESCWTTLDEKIAAFKAAKAAEAQNASAEPEDDSDEAPSVEST
ncbi:MAG: hypothetical protein RLO80_05560 [Hyphomonas sp.]